jgi:hypothetical protein
MPYAPPMKETIAIVVLGIFLAPSTQAQDKKPSIVALSEPALGERGTSRILYWNQEKDMAVAAVTVDFGRPVWKKELEDASRFDLLTKGKVWRLGNDYWTILDTNVPIKIAGREIPIGLWYLGLDRSADGARWSLAFIDPVKARRSRHDGFAMDLVPVDFKVPMTPEKPSAVTEKLTLALSASKEDLKNVTLRVSWGTLQLTAPVQVSLPN